MTTKPLLLVVAGAIFDKNNRVLISKRPVGSIMEDLWEFPGGKVETGETPEEALKREIIEEIDIVLDLNDIKPFSFASYEYDKFHLLMPLFICRTWRGVPKAKEHQEILFVSPKELTRYKMPPADVNLVEQIKKYSDSFFS